MTKNQILMMFLFSLFGISCSKFSNNCVDGIGTIESQSLSFSPFSKINLDFDADLVLAYGSEQQVTIEAQANLIEIIANSSTVNNGQLDLKINKCFGRGEIKIFITVPDLSKLQVSSDSNVRTAGALDGLNNFDLIGSGDSDFDLDLGTLNDLSINASGDCKFRLKGGAKNGTIKVSGDSDVSLFDLVLENCSLNVSGDGDSEVNVTEYLDVRISGDGDVCYKGHPMIDTHFSGDGSLKNCN